MGCGNSLPLGHSSEVQHAVRKVEDQHAYRPHRGHPHPNYVGVSIGYRPLQSDATDSNRFSLNTKANYVPAGWEEAAG